MLLEESRVYGTGRRRVYRLRGNTQIAASLAVLLCALIVGLLLLAGVLKSRASVLLADTAAIAVSIYAAKQCWNAAAVSRGYAVPGWKLIASGIALWGLGEVLFAYFEIVRNVSPPVPSIADLAYLAGYPLLLAGILMLAMAPRSIAWLRTLLDATIVAVLAAGPIWFYLAQPAATEGGASMLESGIAVSYPLGDLLIFFGLAVAALRSWRERAGLVFATLSLGLALIMVSDLGFATMAEESPPEGSWINAGWIVGFALIALAGAMQTIFRASFSTASDDARTAPAWRQIMPLFLLLPSLVWFLFMARAGDQTDALAALLLIAVVLVVIRSALAVVDILELNRELVQANNNALRANEELRFKSRQVNDLLLQAVDASRKDSLTGVLGRAAVVEELEKAIRTTEQPVRVALLDLDDLKTVNDTGGHASGDELLREFAGRLLTLRNTTVGRYGGDEFLAFTVNRDVSIAAFSNEIANALEDMEILLPDGLHAASATWGIASYPDDAPDTAGLINVADVWLYRQKARKHERGRRLIAV